MTNSTIKPDLSVRLGRLVLKNPVTVASGTFGFGSEYAEFYDVSELGAIFTKAITIDERTGNPPPRIAETPAGMLNSIGLQNPGLEQFLKEIVPEIKKINTVIIANVAGNCVEDYVRIASRLVEENAVDAVELNVSCPNVTEGGIEFGKSEKILAELTQQVVSHVTPMPVIVKLTPQVTDIARMAKIAEDAGASAISLINTLPAMVVDWRRERLHNGELLGGLSGPAIRPVALRLVKEVAQSVSIPIIGMGGICTLEDALQFFYVGAEVISIGTGNFINPTAPHDILTALREFLHQHQLPNITALRKYLHSPE
ncbi:dihydroorotate dehydrogenase [Candidatus Sumerlaeota bacterium]|nr:dihydroorotate dehydrogenase [Candidatus Sumerlaeota bacterium]